MVGGSSVIAALPAQTHTGRMQRVAIAGILVLALVIVVPGFSAGLGATDDHDIPVLRAEGIAAIWRPDPGRFRPAYWALRTTEAAVWGENVRGWYLDRLALLVVTVLAGFALLRRWAPPLAAGLGAAAMVLGPQAEAFYRLGPQEAYAVPLTLAGLLLVSRGRFWGLGPVVLATFVKEPFVVVPVVGIIWAWRLGARRSVVLAGIGTAVAVLGIAAAVSTNGGDYYSAQGLAIPSAGRYLFPWVLIPAIGLAVLAARFRLVAVAMAVVLLALAPSVRHDAQAWAASSARFAAFVDGLRAESRPLVVTVTDPGRIEPALALRRYLPNTMGLVSPVPMAGFDDVTGPCLEVAVDAPTGACSEAVSVPY